MVWWVLHVIAMQINPLIKVIRIKTNVSIKPCLKGRVVLVGKLVTIIERVSVY